MEFLSVSWSVFKFHGDSFSFMEFLSVSWSFFQFHGVSLSFMEILSVHALPCLKVHMSVGRMPAALYRHERPQEKGRGCGAPSVTLSGGAL